MRNSSKILEYIISEANFYTIGYNIFKYKVVILEEGILIMFLIILGLRISMANIYIVCFSKQVPWFTLLHPSLAKKQYLKGDYIEKLLHSLKLVQLFSFLFQIVKRKTIGLRAEKQNLPFSSKAWFTQSRSKWFFSTLP